MAKGAATEVKMQKCVDQVSDSCDNYDLTISIKTTEVVYQPAPGKPYKEPTITLKGQRLQVVDKFTYLGSTLSRVVHNDDEVGARIASLAFGRLKIKWQDRIPDTEVLKRAGMQSEHTFLKLAQLRWTGHVTRMHEERLR